MVLINLVVYMCLRVFLVFKEENNSQRRSLPILVSDWWAPLVVVVVLHERAKRKNVKIKYMSKK